MKNKIINGTITFAALLTLSLALLMFAGRNDAIRIAFGDCVAQEATAAGYQGNVYGQEAWQDFAEDCK